jgi:tripartite-type tricarboxylate transporter receptor subunit TctC
VQVGIDVMTGSIQHIQAGTLNALAVAGKARFDALPEVPTIGETVPGYAIASWFAFFGPTGLPPAVIGKLNTEINKALATPALREALEKAGMSATGGKPEELAALLKIELAQREKLVKAAGIEPE